MLRRYVEIRDAIKLVPAVEEHMSSPSTHRQILALVNQLEALDSVCIKMQSEKCSVSDVRVLFDAVVAKYPALADQLKPDARIVHTAAFENAIVKYQSGRVLNAADEAAINAFLVANPPPSRPTKKDFATLSLRRAKKPHAGTKNVYMESLRFVSPTSNRVERLVSQCKLVLTSLHPCRLPAHFETIMFLKANRQHWNFTSLVGCAPA